MTVGTIVKIKVPCLGNPIGTKGVGYYDYGTGTQFIFENGEYDGFNKDDEQSEFLEEVGFDSQISGYIFKNVIQVSSDFRKGVFNSALFTNKQE